MNGNDKEYLVRKIRTQYTEKEHTQLDELKALDSKVKRPPTIFSYVFGSLTAIVMGAGMSLVMTDIGSALGMDNAMVPGILIGIAGLALALINYPIHKAMLASRRKKYASEVIALSEKIINNG